MEKSRNVAPLEFLDVLQLEYINAIIRSKIYPRVADKDHYRKVAKGKEEKIKDIAFRNNLPPPLFAGFDAAIRLSSSR